MTRAIKIIWLTAALVWLSGLAVHALGAEAKLPVRATLIVASNPDELAEMLNEIEPAATDEEAVTVEEDEDERTVNYE